MSNHIVLEIFTDQDLEPKSTRSEWFWTLLKVEWQKRTLNIAKKMQSCSLGLSSLKHICFKPIGPFWGSAVVFQKKGSFFIVQFGLLCSSSDFFQLSRLNFWGKPFQDFWHLMQGWRKRPSWPKKPRRHQRSWWNLLKKPKSLYKL